MLASSMVASYLDGLESIGQGENSIGSSTGFLSSGELHPSKTDRKTEPSAHCLYFLVCADRTGDLAGLCKVGIADSFPVRYKRHRQVWGMFDLNRSALLRVGNRWVAQKLELFLRDAFGGPRAGSGTDTAGNIFTSDDFIANGSWRRYPGRRDEGYTEFYAVECLDKMLLSAEKWLAFCDKWAAGARLQRKINPADCALASEGKGNSPSLVRDCGPGSGARHSARRKREWDDLQTQVVEKLGQVLELALAYESRLIWVNMDHWRTQRKAKRRWYGPDQGLFDLYFNRFSPVSSGTDAGPAHWSLDPLGFEWGIAPLLTKVDSTGPLPWRSRGPQTVCLFWDLADYRIYNLPHPACTDTLRLRVEPLLERINHPLFFEFDALAQRVESRLRWEQPELRLC